MNKEVKNLILGLLKNERERVEHYIRHFQTLNTSNPLRMKRLTSRQKTTISAIELITKTE